MKLLSVLLAVAFLGVLNLQATSLSTTVSAVARDIYWNNSCTDSGVYHAGCNPGSYAASSVPESFATILANSSQLGLRLPVSIYAQLDGTVTNAYASAQGTAQLSDSLVISGGRGEGILELFAEFRVLNLPAGICNVTLQMTAGTNSMSTSQLCDGSYSHPSLKTSFTYGVPFFVQLLLRGETSSDGATLVTDSPIYTQYTSSITATANITGRVTVQRQYWYDPEPTISISAQAGPFPLLEQVNLPPLFTPEPSTFCTGIGALVIVIWRLKGRMA